MHPARPASRQRRSRQDQTGLLNLLTNAVKYNRTGGSIVASIRLEPNQIWFAVQDTGQGIPANLARACSPSSSAPIHPIPLPRNRLGLYICKKIVENHGGGIEANSQENEGTTFQFYLPLTP